MKNNKNIPPRKSIRESARDPSRAAEIIKMIRFQNKIDNNEDLNDDEFETIRRQYLASSTDDEFHNFEKMDIAVNSMGLYRSIMEEVEHENDPKVLKAFFSERLGQVLEAIPDGIASAIDSHIKGLE